MSAQAGPVAIVTGAAGGIGAATARRLAAGGTRLMVTDLDAVPLSGLAGELGALARSHDVTSESGWREVVSGTLEHFGRLDVLVNNAASFTPPRCRRRRRTRSGA